MTPALTTASGSGPNRCLCRSRDTPRHPARHAHQSTKTALLCSSARDHQSICHTVRSRNLRSTSFECTTRHHARYQHPVVRSKDSRVRLVVRSSDKESAEPDEIPELSNTDWRQFRARLIATDKGQQDASNRWAHDVSKPEQGCLLLAHPLMFGETQSYFSQAVIFMFEHGNSGSAGFILNRPTELTLGKLVAADALLPEFADNLLYLGGDVGSDAMHFLHGCADTEGALEVVQGVFMGGFESARSAVKSRKKSANQFRWFNKYAGWGPGQLDREVAAGVWFTVAASSEVILNQKSLARSEMWHSILDLMGGDYAALSASVKEAYPDNLPRDGS